MALGGQVDANGVTIAYEVTGSPADPTVLLLHGIADNLHSYDAIAPKLAVDGFRVIAIDLRGHGSSSAAAVTGLRDHAADAVAVIDELVGEPAVIVGHSLGGLVGISIAARHPDRCRALLVEDPTLMKAADLGDNLMDNLVDDDLDAISQPVHLVSGVTPADPDRYLAEVRAFLGTLA
jgi:pimeloyl-ACP methyl ester carboxylesterase